MLHSYWKKVLQRLQILNNLEVVLICVSDWQKQNAINNGFTKENIHVIRQAIITQNYEQPDGEHNSRDFTVGYLGRLSPEKGASFLLKVIDTLLAKSKFKFLLGIPLSNCNPDDVFSLRKLSKKAAGRITVLENINSSNKDLFFKELDCLFIPSFCIETGPIVLLESLIFNKQVIAPDVGGPLEYKEEFKENITMYKWNDLNSAIESLKLVSKIPRTHFDNYSILREKENLFIKMHEDIYSESVYKLKTLYS